MSKQLVKSSLILSYDHATLGQSLKPRSSLLPDTPWNAFSPEKDLKTPLTQLVETLLAWSAYETTVTPEPILSTVKQQIWLYANPLGPRPPVSHNSTWGTHKHPFPHHPRTEVVLASKTAHIFVDYLLPIHVHEQHELDWLSELEYQLTYAEAYNVAGPPKSTSLPHNHQNPGAASAFKEGKPQP